MKKLLLIAGLIVLLIVIIVAVFVIVQFSALQSDSELPEGDRKVIEEYVAENYPEYGCKYDASNQTLTLTKSTEFMFESAESIYTDHNTYLMSVSIIAADISVACNQSDLVVFLRYDSKDGEPMYCVASDGTIIKYWE